MTDNDNRNENKIRTDVTKHSRYSLSPKKLREEALEYEWDLSPVKWLLITLVSVVSISLFAYFSFGKEELLLLLGFSGIVVPKILLNHKKRKHRIVLLDRLLVFLNAFTSTLLVTHQPVKALKEIKGLQHPTVQEEIEKIIISLSSGISVKKSFDNLIKKYPFKMLNFYVDQLDIAITDGGNDTYKILTSVVNDIESEKTLIAKLKTELVKEKRAFYQNAVFVLAMPFAFNFMPKIAEALTESLPGKVVIVFNFLAVIVIYFIVRRLANFNPMSEK
ncbi:hypothetical protein MKY22_17140 [Exiguobacterium sp. FSL W8-0210]|uniref:hypothetical protein n=1 Tax=Exiguobacterium sp. FSL W8-0210 TaxID=2921598 RepID=UPI0030F96077